MTTQQQPAASDFGSVTATDGTIVTLTQEAYPDAWHGGESTSFAEGEAIYRAAGVDTVGNVYSIAWSVTGAVEGDDASNACSWDSPESVVLVARAE